MQIRWTGTFDAAHFIDGHPKCGRLHGHTYRVEVVIWASSIPTDGMIIDYGLIKDCVQQLDHKLLVASTYVDRDFPNKIHVNFGMGEILLRPESVVVLDIPITSAEHIALWLKNELYQAIYSKVKGASLEVTVSETPSTSATAS